MFSNWLQKRHGRPTRPKAAIERRLLEEGFNRPVCGKPIGDGDEAAFGAW